MTKDISLRLITKSINFTKTTKVKSYQILRLISKQVTKRKTKNSKRFTESGKWEPITLIIYLFGKIKKDQTNETLQTQVDVKPKREINNICHHLQFLGHVNQKKINRKLIYKKGRNNTSKKVQKLIKIRFRIFRKAEKKFIRIPLLLSNTSL